MGGGGSRGKGSWGAQEGEEACAADQGAQGPRWRLGPRNFRHPKPIVLDDSGPRGCASAEIETLSLVVSDQSCACHHQFQAGSPVQIKRPSASKCILWGASITSYTFKYVYLFLMTGPTLLRTELEPPSPRSGSAP